MTAQIRSDIDRSRLHDSDPSSSSLDGIHLAAYPSGSADENFADRSIHSGGGDINEMLMTETVGADDVEEELQVSGLGPDVGPSDAIREVETDPEELAQDLRQLGWHLDENEDVRDVEALSTGRLAAGEDGSSRESSSSESTPHGMSSIVGNGLCDHLSAWPIPFPEALVYRARQPPKSLPQPKPVDFLTLAVYTVVLTLSARFNATTRAVNYVLQCVIVLINHCLAISTPDTSLNLQSSTETSNVIQPAKTVRTALAHLAVDDEVLLHPTCSNSECHNVFYEIKTVEGFTSLPEHCPACQHPLYVGGIPSVLKFPRVSLQQFLSRTLSAPGVEELIEEARIRRKRREDQDDAFRLNVAGDPTLPARAAFTRIYRERADGDEYQRLQELLDRRARNIEDSLTCQLDLYVDWYVLHIL